MVRTWPRKIFKCFSPSKKCVGWLRGPPGQVFILRGNLWGLFLQSYHADNRSKSSGNFFLNFWCSHSHILELKILNSTNYSLFLHFFYISLNNENSSRKIHMNNPYAQTLSPNSQMVQIFSVIYKIFHYISNVFHLFVKVIKIKEWCKLWDSEKYTIIMLDSTTTYHYIEFAIMYYDYVESFHEPKVLRQANRAD